jgi:hypothetical protein
MCANCSRPNVKKHSGEAKKSILLYYIYANSRQVYKKLLEMLKSIAKEEFAIKYISDLNTRLLCSFDFPF